MTTILNGLNPIGQGTEDDKFVWNDSAGRVFPFQRVWKTQRHYILHAMPGFRPILDTREDFVVNRERILEFRVKEEPESPGPSTGGHRTSHGRRDESPNAPLVS